MPWDSSQAMLSAVSPHDWNGSLSVLVRWGSFSASCVPCCHSLIMDANPFYFISSAIYSFTHCPFSLLSAPRVLVLLRWSFSAEVIDQPQHQTCLSLWIIYLPTSSISAAQVNGTGCVVFTMHFSSYALGRAWPALSCIQKLGH